MNLAAALSQVAGGNKRVGILDLDIFGPSVPKLMGLDSAGEPELTKGWSDFFKCSRESADLVARLLSDNHLIPLSNYGIPCMSMAFLLPPAAQSDTPVVWRGMMVMKAVQQLLFDVDWRSRHGNETDLSSGRPLDLLVVDLPPGTGDVQLSLGQLVKCEGKAAKRSHKHVIFAKQIAVGSVIVSTPQDVALIDVRKGVAMFRKIGIPVCTSDSSNGSVLD